MGAYFARRLLLMIPTFLGITMIVFMITRFVPGGPIEQILIQVQGGGGGSGEVGGGGGRMAHGEGSRIPPAVMAELEKKFGFDKPPAVAYVNWLADTVRLDLGKSYKYNVPVLDVITSRFPVSLYFGFIGF